MNEETSQEIKSSSETEEKSKSVSDMNIKALVVEDFETMRNIVNKTLDNLNIRIFEAANGIEALKILDNEPVDIVLTDLVMPEMDGFELCEEIRRRPNIRHLPVIVISTHRDAKYVVHALRCGADDYLTKPFTSALAKRIIERVLSNV
ncbi:MAG: response regulator [Sedimentisphaerales bacterium]|nr:response regulator [Sedimentisphaerales bacterium]